MQATKEDMNGLGKRVGTVEGNMKAEKVKTARNETDIQKVFASIARLPYFIIGSMLVPSGLIIYQIASKTPTP